MAPGCHVMRQSVRTDTCCNSQGPMTVIPRIWLNKVIRTKVASQDVFFFRYFSIEIYLLQLQMKSKYAKEYSNLKNNDIKVLKRRNELSSSRPFDSQKLSEIRLQNENRTY